MKLEIILRTCDCKNVSQYSRFISVSKAELILGCVASPLSRGIFRKTPYINWREWWKHYMKIEAQRLIYQ